MKTTIAALLDAITEEFRKFGFEALNGVVKQTSRNGRDPTGTVRFEFAPEIPTGMVAFSQKTLDVWAEIYSPVFETKFTPSELLKMNIDSFVDEVCLRVDLRTSYTHHDGGSNGSYRQYVYLTDGRLVLEQDYYKNR